MSTPDPRAAAPPRKLLVLAPNWLGDAVMALPLLADLRRAWPATEIVVAARASVAPLYAMVPAVHATVVLETRGVREAMTTGGADAARLARLGFDAALLLPNSFLSAWLVWRAGIGERWGFARDLRGRLLTRAIPRPRDYGHQVEYYQMIGQALGVPAGPPFAEVRVSPGAQAAATGLLRDAGLGESDAYVVFAPGAAYGRAKQWLPRRFADLSHRLATVDVATILVGAKADRPACAEIARMSPAIDLSGRTDLPTLAGVLAQSAAVVANDSGAMHLAAAVGAAVVAVFGPTNEHRTSPLRGGPDAPAPHIVTEAVWCRPCMLRECPIDHRCMSRIAAARVFETLGVHLPSPAVAGSGRTRPGATAADHGQGDSR